MRNTLTHKQSASVEKREVFHEIFGLTISSVDPVVIGDFRLYNYNLHKTYLGKIYFPEHPNAISGYGFSSGEYDENRTWVSVTVDAIDTDEAIKVADEKFEVFQSIFRFFVSFIGDDYDIGILNYRHRTIDETIILSSTNRSLRGHAKGTNRTIDYNILRSQLSGISISIENMIEMYCKQRKSKIEKKLITSLIFYGRAFLDLGKPISFLESMMAIEALIQRESDPFVSQSVSAQIVEYCTFLLGKTYDERIVIDKQMRNYYNIRSKLAHGESSKASMQERKDVLLCARKLITAFITDSDINTFSDPDGLREYILKLKYT